MKMGKLFSRCAMMLEPAALSNQQYCDSSPSARFGSNATNANSYILRKAHLNGAGQMFDSLTHSDWSASDRKKWMTAAKRTTRGWEVFAPQRVPCALEFIDRCLLGGQIALAGFDFPIGVPVAFGRKTGFENFRDAS
jgi:hypothetical protein